MAVLAMQVVESDVSADGSADGSAAVSGSFVWSAAAWSADGRG